MDESKESILIIDDNMANLKLLQCILNKKGYKIQLATTGKRGLKAARAKLPNLILLDIKLPDMDGYSVCKELKADPSLHDIPIIFISGKQELDDKMRAFSIGAVDYLTKPFEPEEVIARAKTHLTINALKNELEQANETLEDKIKIRTEALRKSEEKYKRLFENTEISIWNEDMLEVLKALETLKAEGVENLYDYLRENREVAWNLVGKVKVLHVNEATLKLFGAASERDMLNQIDKTFGPDAIDVFIDELCAIWEKRKVFRSEATFKTFEGKEFTAMISFRIPETEEGFQSLPVSIIDITDRKQKEMELASLRNYLTNIIDSMPSVLVGVDTNGKVTQWNKTAEKATGITASSAQGKDLSDVYPQMRSEMDKVEESIQTRQIKQEQKQCRPSKGGGSYQDVTIYPLIANGVQGAVIRIDDVTEKVRMEEMMIQSEKMLSIGGLAAGMAHEINNPMAALLQTAQVMERRLAENMNIPANHKAALEAGTTMMAIERYMVARNIFTMLESINKSGQRVATIVNNMLAFARKDTDERVFISPNELIEQTLALATADYDPNRQYDFKLIKIQKEYNDPLPPIPCEKNQIQQVLLNLFRNGAQAMFVKGTKEPRFIIKTYEDKIRKMVTIQIEDNGPGMDEEIRKRVFEPFFTTKPPGIGTGLGLSVSYFIITKHHCGEMTAESQPGFGAKFTIRLPISEDTGKL